MDFLTYLLIAAGMWVFALIGATAFVIAAIDVCSRFRASGNLERWWADRRARLRDRR